MNILIVKLSAIGDVIHTLPSLAALRRLYPEACITWVVEEAAADLLQGHPDLDRVLVSRRKAWLRALRSSHIAAPLGEAKAFLKALRSRSYDLVIDFHGLFKSAVLVGLSGGRRRLGYASLQEGSGLFYNEKIPEDMGKHAVDRYLDLIRHLARQEGREAAADGEPAFTIAIGKREQERVEALLAPIGAPGGQGKDDGSAGKGQAGRFVAVSPVAFWESKLWEDGKFAALCDRIQGELGLAVVLTSGERSPLERIQNRMTTEALNLGGETSLRELACLYRQAALVVSTDSGPMHLAAAMGTPVVALFGPTDPARTGPYGPRHQVIQRRLDCAPCLRRQCPTGHCMREIEADDVLAAIRGVLEKGGIGIRPEAALSGDDGANPLPKGRSEENGNQQRATGDIGLPPVQG